MITSLIIIIMTMFIEMKDDNNYSSYSLSFIIPNIVIL